MQFVQHSDPQSYYDAVHEFLMENELLNNVVIGLLSRMLRQRETFGDLFLGHVESDVGDVMGATMMARDGVILSSMKDRGAMLAIVYAYAEYFDSVFDVVGEPEDSETFATLWREKTGQTYHIMMEYGYYKLEKVIAPENVSGSIRPATDSDFDMLADWLIQFNIDTGQDVNFPRNEAERNIRRKLDKPILGGIRIWMDEGQPVSMAAVTRELPNGGNISMVYTPKDYRGHGYASAVTAAVSQEILDIGKSFACLATDMANPTSNKIYQAIGYEFVGNHRRIKFEN